MEKPEGIRLIATAFVSGIVAAWVVATLHGPVGQSVPASAKESAYERVMHTQTLRCGYVLWTPFLVKDPNNAKLSGLFYAYTEALGAALHLKIDWVEETGWGDFPAALASGRIDALCSGAWPNAERAREIDFVQPIIYQPTYIYARAGDTRFDNNVDAVNDPSATIVFVEGTTIPVIVANDFPKAKTLPLPQLTSLSDSFVSLAAGKADVVFANPEAFDAYNVSNPGKIRRVMAKYPLRLFGNSIAVAGGEARLKRMLDMATEEMLSSGRIDKIINQYPQSASDWLRVAVPYQNVEAKP